MPSRAVAAVAVIVVLLTFAVDAVTPQTLVVAIVFDVPIVLAALTRSRRLTAGLVGVALAADVAAAFINAARDGYRWEPLGLADRGLSMLSIVLVGFLSTVVQERAERVGRLAAQEARARREAALASAAERVRSSLSGPVVTRAIVREAPAVLEATAAFWYPADSADEILAQRSASRDVEVLDERPSPEIASLIRRTIDDGTVTPVRAGDPVGRFVLDRLSAASALAVPVMDGGRTYGVVVAASKADGPDDAALAAARGFAVLCANALAQARLFAEIGERNEALSERQAVIRDLVYALSHDVRTPLAALSMTLRQAAHGDYGTLPDSYATVLRESLVSIEDLQRLADTLLLVARFESGDRRPARETVDLRALTADVCAEMRPLAEARGVDVRSGANGDGVVRAARADVRRAVTNLVANAIAHTPVGGAIDVRVEPAAGGYDVRVIDDGYGVEPALRAELFTRFAAAPAGGGTGLGLYIVRRIAEENGGAAHYEPNAPRGSIFIMHLPRAAP